MKSLVFLLLAFCKYSIIHRSSLDLLTRVLTGVAASPTSNSNSQCNTWCQNTNFPGSCASQAKDSLGPCYECGPYKTSSNEKLCDGVCADTSNDVKNCGSCENLCGSKQICSTGKCVKATTSSKSASSSTKHSSSLILSSSSAKAPSSSHPPATSTSSTSTPPAASSCPTPAINKGYKHEVDAGPGCDYLGAELGPTMDGNDEFYYFDIDPTFSKEKGVPICAAACSAIADCQTFEWHNITNAPVPFYTFCEFNAAPYNASYLYCGETSSQTVSLSLYSMTNWKKPGYNLQNAGFETGCLFPWQVDLEVGNATDFYAEVIPCDKSVKGDCIEGDYYAHLYGGTPGVPKYDGGRGPYAESFYVSLSNWPITTQGVNYTVTVWVKGLSGSLKMNSLNGPTSQLESPTGEWQQIETWFIADYGYPLILTAIDGYVIDYYIDDIQVFESQTT